MSYISYFNISLYLECLPTAVWECSHWWTAFVKLPPALSLGLRKFEYHSGCCTYKQINQNQKIIWYRKQQNRSNSPTDIDSSPWPVLIRKGKIGTLFNSEGKLFNMPSMCQSWQIAAQDADFSPLLHGWPHLIIGQVNKTQSTTGCINVLISHIDMLIWNISIIYTHIAVVTLQLFYH